MKKELRLLLAVLVASPAGPALPVTFTEDVVPILSARCVSCHRPGQMAPMSLTSYDEVRPWAKSIRREVAARRMPPFHAAGPLDRYVNDIRLTQYEIDTILSWIDQDTPKGPGNDQIETGHLETEQAWVTGNPDFVVEFPRASVPGGIGDGYLLLYGQPAFEEAVWIEALEWQIGNTSVVHHIVPYFIDANAPVPPDGISSIVNMNLDTRVDSFGAGYLPGAGTYALGQSEAILIPAQTRLVAEMHFQALDTSTTDQTRIGFHFADGLRRPAEPVFHLPVHNIRIAPGDPEYTRVEVKKVEHDVFARGFRFHMHLRGKSGTLDLRLPDGHIEPLIAVPNYDFNWQRLYELKDPILLPAGSEVVFTAVWDNSPGNPDNPNPAASVRTGPTTNDEMGAASIFVSRTDTAEPLVQLRDGRVLNAQN